MTSVNAPPGFLDLLEAARLLRINPQSLRRLIKQGAVPGVQLVHGKYLLDAEQLYQFASTYSPQPGRRPWYRRL